jgi:hypothetical protein
MLSHLQYSKIFCGHYTLSINPCLLVPFRCWIANIPLYRRRHFQHQTQPTTTSHNLLASIMSRTNCTKPSETIIHCSNLSMVLVINHKNYLSYTTTVNNSPTHQTYPTFALHQTGLSNIEPHHHSTTAVRQTTPHPNPLPPLRPNVAAALNFIRALNTTSLYPPLNPPYLQTLHTTANKTV